MLGGCRRILLPAMLAERLRADGAYIGSGATLMLAFIAAVIAHAVIIVIGIRAPVMVGAFIAADRAFIIFAIPAFQVVMRSTAEPTGADICIPSGHAIYRLMDTRSFANTALVGTLKRFDGSMRALIAAASIIADTEIPAMIVVMLMAYFAVTINIKIFGIANMLAAAGIAFARGATKPMLMTAFSAFLIPIIRPLMGMRVFAAGAIAALAIGAGDHLLRRGMGACEGAIRVGAGGAARRKGMADDVLFIIITGLAVMAYTPAIFPIMRVIPIAAATFMSYFIDPASRARSVISMCILTVGVILQFVTSCQSITPP